MSCDKFLQFQHIEIVFEIFPKFALCRIIAITKDNLPFEMFAFPVMFQLFFYIRELCIKLILLGSLGLKKILTS